MKNVFKEFNLYKSTKISWWEKFLLMFKPVHVGYDSGYGGDKSVTLYVKWLKGKMYIINEENN